MLIKFKKTGRVTNSKAGEKFVKLGLAEPLGVKKVEEKEPQPVKKELKASKKRPAKRRGRPAKKK